MLKQPYHNIQYTVQYTTIYHNIPAPVVHAAVVAHDLWHVGPLAQPREEVGPRGLDEQLHGMRRPLAAVQVLRGQAKALGKGEPPSGWARGAGTGLFRYAVCIVAHRAVFCGGCTNLNLLLRLSPCEALMATIARHYGMPLLRQPGTVRYGT